MKPPSLRNRRASLLAAFRAGVKPPSLPTGCLSCRCETAEPPYWLPFLQVGDRLAQALREGGAGSGGPKGELHELKASFDRAMAAQTRASLESAGELESAERTAVDAQCGSARLQVL